ncbi:MULTISPECIES: L-threonine dehydrogenase [Shewanella]|uniref:L-threonine dehydrogenase n=1 Tax=Shewanella TaxID=22 RepID=UPI000C641127|nr:MULTISPECIES: L-threonine dehydrogenase [Shewanella]NCQ44499.1 L-threonine dehydrogenase [Shewanella frigidimarina]MBB1322685.1 L-threonine dehydrogenase [Shewanella sp. SR43-8]MBB1474387.1 L-threonine dehydrogenase [Shewanella sp. SG41-3]NCO72162.1 L-threonine dehydrogenase [Shewanella vesiculosa]NCP35842.1 L-threonine dehydrogenase [Shewanella vesiculosa]|tara:strand:+ start:2658 stop:3806 length:1149 start_codon:yes stop_codon:yes gene_type:complete
MATKFFIPSVNILGQGSVDEAIKDINAFGFTKALIVTDKPLVSIGLVAKVTKKLNANGIEVVIFDGVQPNPTTGNVAAGLELLTSHKCDFIISLGGGSPHDCAKGIALVATNGGNIKDYEGVDVSIKAQMPLVAINTTAGTASEMTRFCIITDEARHIKMAIVDKNTTPILSVNDPELMLEKPASLTAATGMDALTHAIEAYVSIAANPITDACAIKAIELIQANLINAVKHGDDIQARENMAYAQFLAGMAFNNASLGYVHAMAHQLGGFYDLPHGVCNALLLPHVQTYNAQVVPARLADVAKAMGIDITAMSDDQGAKAAIDAIKQLSTAVNIPANLTELGVKAEDIPTLADNALKDACGFTNPKQATHAEICQIFTNAL